MSITFNFHSPIHRQAEQRPSSALADLAMTWLRARRWIIAKAKQVLRIVAVFAAFAAIVAAIIALRVAIWLPPSLHP